MQLKPQDILFLLKLVAIGDNAWSYNGLAAELGMSASEVHAAANRAVKAGLAIKQGANIQPHVGNLTEFLVHGVRYVFVPERGELCTGLPTAFAVRLFSPRLNADEEPTPVWPDPEGSSRGVAFSPLYKSAPFAAKRDPLLYELLAQVDAVRGGSASERELAKSKLAQRLSFGDDLSNTMARNDEEHIVIGETVVVSRRALQQLVQRYHIRRLALFGSAARGKLGPNSDIDLLVEFETGKSPSLGGMVQLQDEFVRLFGERQVDIATPTILNNPYRRQAIERDMQELYAA